ncbi:hypothetical protein TRFO_32576 [Tritrichomonas foetus]|uniref:Sulfatase N-terminal domain-containing protein n=1 Tax=Tritrichomonas foetus TaxID=1144522 RepID=A0A1J4JNK8_9EUKA|nr:hypothetical protein TRFO_32576 [Tritrichomonas foetus]|eukprot:OHT00667.1 hypothetical protein TRFO_32576 [Tritrichomonas foetus]
MKNLYANIQQKEKPTLELGIHFPHIAFLIFLEYFQMIYGQSFMMMLIDTLFFICVFALVYHLPIYSIVVFACLAYELVESISWLYTNAGITFRIMAAVDFTYALNAMPENIMRCFYWFILIFGFSSSKFVIFKYKVAVYEYLMIMTVLFISFFPFYSDKYNTLFPFRIRGLISADNTEKIIKSFNTAHNVTLKPRLRKNLIMFEVESFETKDIGRFNEQYPLSMPYLSNLSKSILHYHKIPSQPYTTWSAAGMFVAQCGFPLVVSNVDWSVRGNENFQAWSKLPCISDYLHLLGYEQHAYCSGSCDIMNMKGFMINHHFKTFDNYEHQIEHDLPLFDHLIEKVLPELTSKKDQPFSLFVLNSDTHPEFFVDDTCILNFISTLDSYPKVFQSFTCFDKGLKKFIESLNKFGINKNNTELIIYGDHLTMGSIDYAYGTDRTLSVLFPFHEKNEYLENKPITYYDIAPTILDMLGIQYKPQFPFGYSIFSENEGEPPSIDDIKFIYNYVTGDITNQKVYCGYQKGFCHGNEY